MAVKDFYTRPDADPQLGADHAENIRAVVNDLITAYEAVLAKLDGDAGISDTDYVSLHGGVDTLGAP